MNQELHDLSGAYALDALSDTERSAFDRHLSTCHSCREEVVSARSAVTELAAEHEMQPPPALRAAVLAEIAKTVQLPADAAQDDNQCEDEQWDGEEWDEEAWDFAAEPDARHVRSIGTVPTAVRRPWSPLVAAAAAAVILVGGGIIVRQLTNDPAPPPTVAQQVLQADDAITATAQVTGGGVVKVVRSAALNKAVFVAEDLPPAPPGQVYQMWWRKAGDTFASAGLVPAGADKIMMRGDAVNPLGAGLTLEPEGGSTQPTTTPLAMLSFS